MQPGPCSWRSATRCDAAALRTGPYDVRNGSVWQVEKRSVGWCPRTFLKYQKNLRIAVIVEISVIPAPVAISASVVLSALLAISVDLAALGVVNIDTGQLITWRGDEDLVTNSLFKLPGIF